MGLTIVDSLDTLIILGLMEEYTEARYWVANHLDLNQGSVSVSLRRSLSVGWAVRCAGFTREQTGPSFCATSFVREGYSAGQDEPFPRTGSCVCLVQKAHLLTLWMVALHSRCSR